MASWITIYLGDAIEKLVVNEIKKGISPADWWTLGEEFDLEEEEIDNFMDHLSWKSEPLGFGQPGSRPIQIHIWSDPARIKEEITEVLENPIPARVEQHLGDIKTIVAIELGISQMRTMYEVIAFEIAYWLAETKHGMICSPYDLWFDHHANRWQAIE